MECDPCTYADRILDALWIPLDDDVYDDVDDGENKTRGKHVQARRDKENQLGGRIKPKLIPGHSTSKSGHMTCPPPHTPAFP